MPEVKPQIETFAKIKVVGIGGSGNSIVNRMVQTGVRGVDFLVMNTDVQALHNNEAENKLHIGKEVTRGLGAGMDPEIGRESAQEAEEDIREALEDTDMAFITCGLGGGTGSGASPVVAEIAKDMGVLTVGVVTKPFSWEGPQRADIAQKANEALASNVDTIITIPNDKIMQVINKDTSLIDAFEIVDDVLRQGVQGISELITVPGLVNVDFADVKTIMKDRGSALMGIGEAEGKNRAIEAAQKAVSSPLLELSIDGAKGILFSISGGEDMGMQEVSEAAKVITESADDNAQVIFGAVLDEDISDKLRVTVIATGFDSQEQQEEMLNGNRNLRQNGRLNNSKPNKNRSTKNRFEKKSFDEEDGNSAENNKENGSEENERSDFQKKAVDSSKQVSENNSTQSETDGSDKESENKEQMQQEIEQEKGDKDDLEIPAFIRKKMDS